MMAVFRLTLSDLVHDPLRTLFSALGIAAVVMSALLLNTLAGGLSIFVAEAPLSTNLVVVDASFIDPSDSTIPPDLLQTLQAWTPNPVLRISRNFFRQLRIEEHIMQVRAADLADWEPVHHLSLVEGRWPSGLHEVAVGQGAAVANNWAPGRRLVIFGEDFTISAVYRAPGTGFSAIWMSMEAAGALFSSRNLVQALTLQLAPGADPVAISSELQNSALIKGKFNVFLEDSYTHQNGMFVRDLYQLISLFGLLALLAVPLSSYSLTLLSLAERMHALGILRAIGFSQASVRGFLLMRAVTLALGAYLLGTAATLIYIATRQTSGPIIIMGFPFKFSLNGAQTLLFLSITLVFALAGAWLSSGRPLRVTVSELLRG